MSPKSVWGLRDPRRRTIAVLACAFATTAIPAVARADKASGSSLYDQADKLMKASDFAAACEKFAASEQEYPRPVTLLRLGDCYERIGKTASAWVTFREAVLAARAAQSNPEFDARKEKTREEESTRRRDAAEKKLTRLKVTLTTPVDGATVKRDGKPIAKAEWGSEIPVDPGTIVLEASAPGCVAWRESREVKGEGVTIEVVVPAFEAEKKVTVEPPKDSPFDKPKPAPLVVEAPTSSRPLRDEGASSGSTQRVAGFVVGGVGLLVGSVGSYLFFRNSAASVRDPNGDGICPPNDPCNDAKSRRSLGGGLAIAGVVTLVGGVVLVATAPSDAKKTSGVRATVALSPMGLVIDGSF